MTEENKYTHMVVRTSSFATHWSDPPCTFGPMPEEQAREMIGGQYGGHMMTVAEFIKAGYR